MKNKIKVNCLLIKKQPFSESSVLLQVFSDKLGMISVLAKGIYRSKGDQSILLNILNEYEMVISEAAPGSIHILSELHALDEYPTDLPLETWFTAQAGAEFITKLLFPEEEIPSFYRTLKNYLHYQKDVSTNSIAIFWRFLMNIFNQLGVPINLNQCTHCHKDMDVQAGYTADTGQLICANCLCEMHTAYLLEPEAQNLMKLLPVIGNYLNDLVISKETIQQLNHFFMNYVSIQFHKTIYLKSLEYYK